MAEGMMTYPQYYDEATGTLQPWEGRDSVDNYITPDRIDCANAAATTIATITAGFKGYVTFISMYNSHTAAQTFTLTDNAGADTKLELTIGTLETVTWLSDNPIIVLDAGVFQGQAGTADFIKTTVTYFERKA